MLGQHWQGFNSDALWGTRCRFVWSELAARCTFWQVYDYDAVHFWYELLVVTNLLRMVRLRFKKVRALGNKMQISLEVDFGL